jgi:hypothetical protein
MLSIIFIFFLQFPGYSQMQSLINVVLERTLKAEKSDKLGAGLLK